MICSNSHYVQRPCPAHACSLNQFSCISHLVFQTSEVILWPTHQAQGTLTRGQSSTSWLPFKAKVATWFRLGKKGTFIILHPVRRWPNLAPPHWWPFARCSAETVSSPSSIFRTCGSLDRFSRACRDISSDSGDISNYFTSDSSPSAPPAVEPSVNFPSGAANAAAADLSQAAGKSALPSNPGSQSTSPVLRRSSRTSRIPRRLITEI